MGATVCRAVDEAPDLDLVAVVDPGSGGRRLGEVAHGLRPETGSLEVCSSIEELASRTGGPGATAPQVAVDFTVAAAAVSNLVWCAAHGLHAVCGTTGMNDDDMGRIEGAFGASRGTNAVLAANFSIGAALMMRCAELCAPYFDGVEVLELHHDHKRDAPSGTALSIARRIETARLASNCGPLTDDPTEKQILAGARGGALSSGVRIHSVRLPGFVAHHEVLLGATGETLTVRHDSTDRVSFMPGVLLAVRKVAMCPGVTIGLEPLLGI